MATLKVKDMKNIGKDEMAKKMKELKMELVKSRSGNSKTNSKTKEIKKIIARMLTLNKAEGDDSPKEVEKNK